jgi:hypothetical protein
LEERNENTAYGQVFMLEKLLIKRMRWGYSRDDTGFRMQ